MVKCYDIGRNYIHSIFVKKSCANLQSVALSMTKYLLHGMTCNNSTMSHALPCNKYILSSLDKRLKNVWHLDNMCAMICLGKEGLCTQSASYYYYCYHNYHSHNCYHHCKKFYPFIFCGCYELTSFSMRTGYKFLTELNPTSSLCLRFMF